jgi:hypothetical protein
LQLSDGTSLVAFVVAATENVRKHCNLQNQWQSPEH